MNAQTIAKLNVATDEADSALNKALAALAKYETTGAAAIKSTLADLDARLKRLEVTQDAFSVPLHRRKG